MPSERNGNATNDFDSSRALLIGVELRGHHALFSAGDSLDELALLASTAGVQVVGREVQRVGRIDPATFVGSGKLEEIAETLTETGANMVIFDDELSPRHQREIERALGEHVQVLDRSALILDIFAQHARTREGALQVELAQYEYRLPRLTRQWTHLARQTGGASARGGAGGGVGLRGPGETQLEVDRREIGRRIAHLKGEIEEVRKHRAQYRRRRIEEAVPVVALVGYTNAGKSTLLNALSGSTVYAADQLFATLDPTTRRVKLPGGREVLFTDTVGFIQKLPTALVAAFRATLEEIAEADLIVHVVDITHQNVEEQVATVLQVLDELGAGDQPLVTALNKIDRLPEPSLAREATAEFTHSVAVSALTGEGLPELLASIEQVLDQELVQVAVRLPYQRGDLLGLMHQRGVILDEIHEENGTRVVARIPATIFPHFEPYLMNRA